jgi:Tfp pilus assembly protein FimT
MKRTSPTQQRGASLIELVVVVAVMMVLTGMAIVLTATTTTRNRVNAANDEVVNALRQARQLAITLRRNVTVQFTLPNQIQTTVQLLPGEAAGDDNTSTVVYAATYKPLLLNGGSSNGLQFFLFRSLPNTPMGPLGFGNGSALDFEAVNGGTVGNAIMFTSSGSLVGSGSASATNYYSVGNNNPINATVFIGIPGVDTNTARAITIVGSTGRVRSYSYYGNAWHE